MNNGTTIIDDNAGHGRVVLSGNNGWGGNYAVPVCGNYGYCNDGAGVGKLAVGGVVLAGVLGLGGLVLANILKPSDAVKYNAAFNQGVISDRTESNARGIAEIKEMLSRNAQTAELTRAIELGTCGVIGNAQTNQQKNDASSAFTSGQLAQILALLQRNSVPGSFYSTPVATA